MDGLAFGNIKQVKPKAVNPHGLDMSTTAGNNQGIVAKTSKTVRQSTNLTLKERLQAFLKTKQGKWTVGIIGAILVLLIGHWLMSPGPMTDTAPSADRYAQTRTAPSRKDVKQGVTEHQSKHRINPDGFH